MTRFPGRFPFTVPALCLFIAALLVTAFVTIVPARSAFAVPDDPVKIKGPVQFSPQVHDASLPIVAVVTTGGTIAEKSSAGGGAKPAVSGKDLIAAVPALAKVANIGVVEFSNIDSSQMSPSIWARLSGVVGELLAMEDVAGVVVTHGTDTMAEGAFFLDVTTKGPKPVVFTGAMNDASSPFPDGPGNLYNAVVQAASPKARGWGATVTLNRYVNSAHRVVKTQTTNVQTFESGEYGYLGYVFGGKVERFHDRTDRIHLPLPERLPRVVFLSTFAGADGSLVRHAVDDGAMGLVIEGVGAGNVNQATFKGVEYALSKDVAVVVTTRVTNGAVEPVYGDQGGGATLEKSGCILAGPLDGYKSRLLLMLGLAEYGNDRAVLKTLFER